MPELPEVETTLRGIEPWLKDQEITDIIVRQSSLRWPVADEIGELIGQTITGLRRRSKYLLVDTPVGSAIWHLGMSGSLRLVGPDDEPKKHDHIDWHLSNGKVLRYHDPRRFGALLWQAPGETSEHFLHLGPEPLGPDFTDDHLFEKSRGKSQAVKTFIMDGRVVVGVGNIYANESLFMAGLRPGKAASSLTRAKAELLAAKIKQVLARAIEQGGTTLKDFVGGDGKPGYFQQQLLVYGRAGEACKQCSKALKEVRLGQRSTVYCTQCQR